MNKIEKRKIILVDYLKDKQSMNIAEVIELLHISEATARRLFESLQNEGKIIRTHGGIQYMPDKVRDYLFDDLDIVKIAEKEQIAAKAISLISDKDVIFLESGTTMLRLCYKLKESLDKNIIKGITVFTNSLVNLEVLQSSCKIILVGGEYRTQRRDFIGFVSEKVIGTFRFNKCFLGTDAIDFEEGFMTTDMDTAHIDELIISRSDQVFILSDSSKFSKKSLISFATFEDINFIVTDRNVSEATKKKIANYDLSLIIAP